MKNSGNSSFLEWDVSNWSTALDFWLKHTAQDISKCSALELGSRNGGLSMWIALQGGRVVCSDLGQPSPEAVEQHRASGVSHLIEYRSIDATDIPYTNEFDIVLLKSVLGGVGRGGNTERKARALREVHKALKTGGELFFAENLIASPFHQYLRRRFVQWGTDWGYVGIAELKKYLSVFSHVSYRTVGFAGTFGRSEAQRNFFGKLDQALFNHIVPESWRYIIVGVATK